MEYTSFSKALSAVAKINGIVLEPPAVSRSFVFVMVTTTVGITQTRAFNVVSIQIVIFTCI